MDFEPYYKARKVIEDLLEKELYGPVQENESFGDTDPIRYYSLGILYPQGHLMGQEVAEQTEDSESNDKAVNLCNSAAPSSMAISFTVRAGVESLKLEANFAWYTATEKGTYKRDEHRYIWSRNSGRKTVEFDTSKVKEEVDLRPGLRLQVFLQKKYSDGSKTFTVAMVNVNKSDKRVKSDNELSFFQPKITVEGGNGEQDVFIEKQMRVNLKKDKEVLNLEMLYKHNKTFGIGHGCSVEWRATGDSAWRISSVFLPTYDLHQMKPAYHDDVPAGILSWKYLASARKEDVLASLGELSHSYERWISKQRKELPNLPGTYTGEKGVAESNLSTCDEVLKRLRASIDALQEPDIFLAFQLANQAMLNQRIQYLSSRGKTADLDTIGWYPFQLAFILQEISSVANPNDSYRDIVDLLWFPTGGGKTEAYLGLSAFTLFYRRIQARKEGRLGAGVTILMRYTLRLLTLQQFQRASALICACEQLRRQKPELLGKEQISIGLWVGSPTPNYREDAIKSLEKIASLGIENLKESDANPCQVLSCPWCGTDIMPAHYQVSKEKMNIPCPNDACEFTEGLPLYLVDEDIYDYKPSLVLGTVDKFARMTWEPKVGNLFGIGTEYAPPELIIQDELHLISGPLGTITGLYELAVDYFCQQNGIKAKFIASTATIRNAENQILSLYGREYRQFPPQGLDIRDSYFAIESQPEDKPARKYMGIMGPGKSSTTMLVRIFSVMLFATRHLKDLGYPEEVVDSFWTLTGYFNNLKQLGGAMVHMLDDVQARLKYLYGTKFSHLKPEFPAARPFTNFDELTSRKKSSEIAGILKQLETKYPNEAAFDVITATNMISVGVDVGRLSAMFVNGQPKSNAEYIQATSRVGRQTPGFVIVLQDAARSRDRSHYEQFLAYHSSLYKYVEATSLTPFSERARERALHAVLVSLCRHLIPELKANEDAGNIGDHLGDVQPFIDYILEKVNRIDEREVEAVEVDLEEVLDTWEALSYGDLVYAKNKWNRNHAALLTYFDEPSRDGYPTLNSMRNVDTESEVYLEG